MSAAEKRLVENLRHEFFEVAQHDAPLAIALQAQCDMMQDGDFHAARKLSTTIGQRLDLLAMAQTARGNK
jgi:hypothetical protein